MQRRLATSIILITLSLGASASVRADIFVYNDPQGVVRFTNAPTESSFKPYQNGLTAWPRTNWNWRTGRVFAPARIGHTGGARRQAYDPIIKATAKRHRVEMALVKAVIRAESDFVAHAVSPKGALGLMQLMPATARRHNVSRVFEPQENVDGGVRHLRYLLDRYSGNLKLVVAAYNAGEGAVDKYGGIPPYRETQAYVQRVMQYRSSYLTEG